MSVHQLQNKHWQVGILPKTGASIAYGRVRYGGVWLDVMRPTNEENYNNSSLTSSFLMIPWSNRIREGKFQFGGATYQLGDIKPDGTAMHGDVRNREWTVIYADDNKIHLQFTSTNYDQVNYPFKFQADVEYELVDTDFRMTVKLKNIEHREFPAGFGFHPYFVKGEGDNLAHVKIPCEMYYELEHALPTTGIPQRLSKKLDFRKSRSLGDQVIDDVFTARIQQQPAEILYPEWNLQIDYHADDYFKHFILFAPQDKPYFALEPITNANDGFNLYNQGFVDTGVFLLKPNQVKQGTAFLRVTQLSF